MECICCELEIVKSRNIRRIDDLVCETCKLNGSMVFKETYVGTCEHCGSVEVYYGLPSCCGYACRNCCGGLSLTEQMDAQSLEDALFGHSI
jgi:hypothetical protein